MSVFPFITKFPVSEQMATLNDVGQHTCACKSITLNVVRNTSATENPTFLQ